MATSDQIIRAAIQSQIERMQHVQAMASRATGFARFAAARLFYASADREIRQAGSREWGIDPYEVDWSSVFTPIEAALWHDIRDADLVMYPQYPVQRYFVDFGNPVAKVAIECDGAAYHQDADKDAARQRAIEADGWTVYRISGRDCKTDFDEERMERSAARKLIDHIAQRHPVSRKAGA